MYKFSEEKEKHKKLLMVKATNVSTFKVNKNRIKFQWVKKIQKPIDGESYKFEKIVSNFSG